MSSSEEVRKAVQNLRTALGKTQTEFGAMIGKGLASIQRYEGLVPPKGRTLRQLAELAHNNSQFELARIFYTSLAAELGVEISHLFDQDPTTEAVLHMLQKDPERFARELEAIAKAYPEDLHRVKEELNRPKIWSDVVGAILGLPMPVLRATMNHSDRKREDEKA